MGKVVGKRATNPCVYGAYHPLWGKGMFKQLTHRQNETNAAKQV